MTQPPKTPAASAVSSHQMPAAVPTARALPPSAASPAVIPSAAPSVVSTTIAAKPASAPATTGFHCIPRSQLGRRPSITGAVIIALHWWDGRDIIHDRVLVRVACEPLGRRDGKRHTVLMVSLGIGRSGSSPERPLRTSKIVGGVLWQRY